MAITRSIYSARGAVKGGRKGKASVAGVLELDMSLPKELGGEGGPGANPEQLFAIGYAACFISSMHLIADRKKMAFPEDCAIDATVNIGPQRAGGLGLEVRLVIDLPNIERSVAESLIESADKVCPYSDAIRGNVDVEFILT